MGNGSHVDADLYMMSRTFSKHETMINKLHADIMRLVKKMIFYDENSSQFKTFYEQVIEDESKKILHYVCDRLNESMYYYDGSQIFDHKQ